MRAAGTGSSRDQEEAVTAGDDSVNETRRGCQVHLRRPPCTYVVVQEGGGGWGVTVDKQHVEITYYHSTVI